MLALEYSARFQRDYKKLQKKHFDVTLIDNVIKLIEKNDAESNRVLKTQHKMHSLSGQWAGSLECHVVNFGDCLLVWQVQNDLAVFLRTGTHDDIFKQRKTGSSKAGSNNTQSSKTGSKKAGPKKAKS